MSKHVWTRISYATIQSAKLNDKGEIETVISAEAEEAGDEHAAYGCWICDLPLNVETINTECNPAN